MNAAAAPSLEALGPPVAAEIARLLGHDVGAGSGVAVEELRRDHKVCRVRGAIDGEARSFIVKRLRPGAAQRNRLVTNRWLPWIGLAGVAPAILGGVAEPGGDAEWQIYEDLGAGTLADDACDRKRVAVAVARIAALHTRAAGHPMVAECRREGRDLGIPCFAASVNDARTSLDALRAPAVRTSRDQAGIRDRLRRRLDRLLAESPRRGRLMVEEGGPDTMLHGDLWTTNVVVQRDRDRLRVRLIDWDRAGAGPACYDLSTLLYRFAPAERRWVFDRYHGAVARGGGRLPSAPVFNVLCDTAECARYAERIIWPAIALLREGAEWGWVELAEIERWFQSLGPVLPA